MQTFELKSRYLDRLTDEEFFIFCQENSNLKIERNPDKTILIMSPTGFDTGQFNRKVIFLISLWYEANPIGGLVESDTGFYLPSGAMRNPDLAWVSPESLAKIDREARRKFLYLAPDFVIEIRSESDRAQDTKAKVQEWMENGSRLGWAIDPYQETVTVYLQGQEPTERSFDERVDGLGVLPGFSLDLSRLKGIVLPHE